MTRSKLSRYIDPRLPLTWIVAAIGSICIFAISNFTQIQDNKRVNQEQSARMDRFDTKLEESTRETRDLRDRIISLQATMDQVARMVAVQTTVSAKSAPAS